MRHVATLAIAATLAGGGCGDAAPGREPERVRVFAAASVAHVIEPLADAFAVEHGATVTCNAAASSTLARQIEHGADADLFISANARWMDHAESVGTIRGDSRVDLLHNRLVVVAPLEGGAGSPASSVGADAAALVADAPGRVAMGDPDHVPAGLYAKAALESAGAWGRVAGRVVPMKDARAALRLVERGEVALGVVYATDAASSDRVRRVAEFDAGAHPPIVYPAALTADAGPAAAAFLAFLREPRAVQAFVEAGFLPAGRLADAR